MMPFDAPVTELAVGFFDGVHIGHQKLLAAMIESAREKGAKPVAFTFTNHPALVYAPERAPKLLTSTAERFALLKKFGVEGIVALDFTKEVAAQAPEDFADYLRTTFPQLGTIFCGPNWTFGCNGLGNAAFLREKGFSVTEVRFAQLHGEAVSSTRIRKALAGGDLPLAAKLLGRNYSVYGTVFTGKGLGRSIGFATLNLQVETLQNGLLPFGVYQVEMDVGRGLANWGFAPTMRDDAWRKPVLEVHLMDCDAVKLNSLVDGTSCKVSFLRFIRAEKKFDSIDALREQIRKDVNNAAY